MTEEDWLECSDWSRLLGFLEDRVSRRKLLLSNCALCWALAAVIRDKQCFRAIRVLEAFLDGTATEKELATAHNWARSSVAQSSEATRPTYFARCAVHNLTIHPASSRTGFIRGNECGNFAAGLEVGGSVERTGAEMQLAGVLGLRCVNGPLPFRPVAVDPEWCTSTVMQLASGIYDERDFSTLPILADALQDAGCDNDDILNHFRDPNATHVRGCWALDLVLGKE